MAWRRGLLLVSIPAQYKELSHGAQADSVEIHSAAWRDRRVYRDVRKQ